MNILSTFENKLHGPSKTKTESVQVEDKSRQLRPPKLNLSAQEIRDKVETHFGRKKVSPPPTNALVQEAVEKEEEPVVMSDIGLNDPKSAATQKKLRTALHEGSFNFSAKEKEVLANILGNQ